MGLGLVASVVPAVGQTPPNGYSFQPLGLTGTGYQTGAEYRSTAVAMNAAGQVVGTSVRFNPGLFPVGQDAWLWTGSTTQLIGLTGSDYQYNRAAILGGGVYRFSAVEDLNLAGQAYGYTSRFNTFSEDRGRDAWVWTGSQTRQVGFTGASYEYTISGAGVYRYSAVIDINASGLAVGYSERRTGAGATLGQDTWLWNGTSSQRIGLTAAGYDRSNGTYRYSAVTGINSAGRVAGYSERYNTVGTSLGYDAWLWNGTSYQTLGLTGSEYQWTNTGSGGGVARSSTTLALNAAAHVTGQTLRRNSLGDFIGQDAWIFNGTTTQRIGLTGTGYDYLESGATGRASTAILMNEAGQVVGTTERRNPSKNLRGWDSWIWDGTTTRQIGLTGERYEVPGEGAGGGNSRFSDVTALNAAGQVIGSALRQGAYTGNDAWVWTGTETREIGLFGAAYQSVPINQIASTHRSTTAMAINDAGQVIGVSSRYDLGGGYDGWFYDIDSNTTTLLRFSSRSNDGMSETAPQVLTENGVVLGSYALFDGVTRIGTRAFWWSESDGFRDLGALLNESLTGEGWSYLYDVVNTNGPAGYSTIAGASPWYILGEGVQPGQTTSTTAFLLSVPEPASGCGLLLAAGALLSRRRIARPVPRVGLAG